ncbi:helix-turn-helix domain-containing protein [Sphingomonas sp. MA1305]|uniref:XRE family transcriptional regulator n=1 Tax=Sphingomonas sp. MA1305 TaxID=2479204 RepID=UPI0018DF2DAB|nr:S24 family peptidase [Sphingomonas sp. MA1305]MBI0474244.1 helix-turn-helix domain-containing protein [Sphingomonas sp. MA1305]
MRIATQAAKYARGLEMRPGRAYAADMSTPLAERIKLLRQSRGETQTEFGFVIGATQATVARWEGGTAPKYDALVKLARLAGVTIETFLNSTMRAESAGEVQIVGYVGAGAAIYPFDDMAHGDGFGTVDRPPFVKGKAVAVEVRGDSLIPVAEDGWRLIYAGEQTILEDEVLNNLCVVKLVDGRTLVKRVIRGSKPQRYHLVSTNAPLIEDAEIEWAAKVKAIIPA